MKPLKRYGTQSIFFFFWNEARKLWFQATFIKRRIIILFLCKLSTIILFIVLGLLLQKQHFVYFYPLNISPLTTTMNLENISTLHSIKTICFTVSHTFINFLFILSRSCMLPHCINRIILSLDFFNEVTKSQEQTSISSI